MRSVLQAAAVVCVLVVGLSADIPRYLDWSAPENVGPVVNSPWIEETPFLSRDGLHLYFNSDRPGGYGGADIWMTSRAGVDAPWEPPVNLGPAINTADHESHPTLSVDRHVLYFDRMPAVGGTYDMFWSRRQDASDEYGWESAITAGPCINGPANDSAMIFFEDDSNGITYTYFNSNRAGNPEMYATTYERDGACAPVWPITEINTTAVERNATIRHDGLELVFESTRPGSGSFDLWAATRANLFDPWSTPVKLAALNSPAYDGRPALSWDGTELYFFSNRGGNFDLYFSTRAKAKGN